MKTNLNSKEDMIKNVENVIFEEKIDAWHRYVKCAKESGDPKRITRMRIVSVMIDSLGGDALLTNAQQKEKLTSVLNQLSSLNLDEFMFERVTQDITFFSKLGTEFYIVSHNIGKYSKGVPDLTKMRLSVQQKDNQKFLYNEICKKAKKYIPAQKMSAFVNYIQNYLFGENKQLVLKYALSIMENLGSLAENNYRHGDIQTYQKIDVSPNFTFCINSLEKERIKKEVNYLKNANLDDRSLNSALSIVCAFSHYGAILYTFLEKDDGLSSEQKVLIEQTINQNEMCTKNKNYHPENLLNAWQNILKQEQEHTFTPIKSQVKDI